MHKNITLVFRVEGMQCKLCQSIIERELSALSYVEAVYVDARKKTVTVTGDFEGIPKDAVARDFTVLLSSYSFIFSVKK